MENNTPAAIDKNIKLINKQFDALKSKVVQASQACLNIKIVDETTLALAEQKAATAKEVENLITSLHKTLKAKPLELCQQIDKGKNNLLTPLQQGIDAFKEEKKKYLLAEADKKAKELEQTNKTLEALKDVNTESVEVIKQELQVHATMLSPTKSKGTREVWKFEVVDERELPRQWMKVDEDKVKAYLAIAENKVEHTTGGVRFYKDIIIVAG